MVEKAVTALALFLALAACSRGTPEARLRKLLASQNTGVIHLPGGVIEVSSELTLAPGAHDLEIAGGGTRLIASDRFQGRGMLVIEGAARIQLHDFSIDGNRAKLSKPLDIAPPENAFRVWYPANGVLADRVDGLTIANLALASIVNFPILISRSKKIFVDRVDVRDSGSKNSRGRNNASGGILIEEGSSDFEVRDCTFRGISGTGLWTHSISQAPRQQNGLFAKNHFDTVGRDALQVGHATRVRVEDNDGVNIGFPADVVDMDNLATPVGIDTSGDVDFSEYARNTFREVNGKCIDLDGFHQGVVRDNHCTNQKQAADYPFGNFGIVMNNSHPNTHSDHIEIAGNTIGGWRFGGLFLMGRGNHVIGNHFLRLNLARSEESELLESGIFLARGGARLEETRGNTISGNEISGHGMKTHCIAVGPGVVKAANVIEGNTCIGDPP